MRWPITITNSRRTRPITKGLMAGLALLGLAACGGTNQPDATAAASSAGEQSSASQQPGEATSTTRDLVYHVTAPEGSWLDDRYADGSSAWRSEGTVRGLSSDRQVLLSVGTSDSEWDGAFGLDLYTGEQKWAIPDVECSSRPALNGFALCSRHSEAVGGVVRIDIVTGQESVVLGEDEYPFLARPIAEVDGELIFATETNGGDLVRRMGADGSVVWQTVVTSAGQCQLIGNHLACDHSQSIEVLDASTGQVTHSQELDASIERVVWLSDGFYVVPSGGPEPGVAYDVLDFTGASLGQVTDPWLPSVPGPVVEATYPLADAALSATQVDSVNAAGAVVTEWSVDGIMFSASGQQIGIYFPVYAVSRSGDLVLVYDSTITVYDGDGNELYRPESNGALVHMIDGIITQTAQGEGSEGYRTLVHAPKPAA